MKFISRIKLKRILPAAAFFAAAIFLYAPVLKRGVFLFGNDTIYHDYIMLLFGWGKLKQGTLITWMPWIYSGIPFIGSFAFCPFYPLSWFFLILPFPFAFNFQYILHSILAGAFTYHLLRSFKLDRFPATFGALAFQFSGHFATLCYPGHLQKVQAIVWLPLALSYLHRALYSNKKKYFLFSGMALAMPLLTSHPQIYYYSVFVCTLYFLWCVGNRKKNALSVESRHLLALFFVVICFSLVLSSAQLLPGYECSGFSVRGGGMDFKDAIKSSYPPGELLEMILPRYTGDSIRGGLGTYFGEWGERLVSDYLGMAVIILGLIGMTVSKRMLKLFFSGIMLVSIIVACGVYSPIFKLMYEYIPGMKFFRSPATVMFMISLSAAIMAAFGLEEFLERCREKTEAVKRKKLLTLVAALAGVFLIITIIVSLYYTRVSGKYLSLKNSGSDSALFYHKLTFLVNSLRRSVFFAAVCMATLAAFICIKDMIRKGQLPKKFTVFLYAAVLAIFFIDPAMNDRAFIQPESAKAYHSYLFNSWPDSSFPGRDKFVRLLDLGNELSNKHLVNRIGVPLGYHPIELDSYIKSVNAVGMGSLSCSKLISCSYIVAPWGIIDSEDLLPVEKSPRGNKILYKWKENITPAYVPLRIDAFENEEHILKKLEKKDFDPHKASFFQSGEKYFRKRAFPSEDYKISIREYSENRVSFNCDLPEKCFVVTGDTWMPGWRANLSDGKSIPVMKANYAFRAVEMPKGENILTFTYSPGLLFAGIGISIVSLALWILLVILLKDRVLIKKEIADNPGEKP
jgi:membrane protein YfhO